MLAYALLVLALQIATSMPMPSCTGNGPCPTCCTSGPNTGCDKRDSNNVYSVFDTPFSMTHTGAGPVEDQTSLELYASDGQTQVSCWEHNQTYTVELKSERWCPMKGFVLQLHPDSRGSIPSNQEFDSESLQSIGCNTITHRARLTDVHPSPQVALKYKASRNANYKAEVTFRYIVVYSLLEYVQTSRSFPVCEEQPEPPTEVTPCTDEESDETDNSSPDQPEDNTEPDNTVDPKMWLGPPTNSSDPPSDEPQGNEGEEDQDAADQDGQTEQDEQTDQNEQTEQDGGAEHVDVGITCGKTRPLSNWTRLYNDSTTGIHYTCNIVTPIVKIQCEPTCEQEHEGRTMNLCCGIKKYQPRNRRFKCEACSSEGVAPFIRTFEIMIPKLCSCWECEGSSN